jgi:hypothetical protein
MIMNSKLKSKHPVVSDESPICDWCKTSMSPAKNSVGEAEIKRDDDDIPGPSMPALAPWELSKAEARRKVADYLKTIRKLQDELTEARELIDKLKTHILAQSQAIATRRSNNLRLDRINREQQELIENMNNSNT